MSIYRRLTKTDSGYITNESISYYSYRYGQEIVINESFKSDGATGYWDLDSYFWIVHDYLKVKRQWKHGDHCTNFEASVVAFDILWDEKRYIHAPIVFVGTILGGWAIQLYRGARR